jgi:hypothetical protein
MLLMQIVVDPKNNIWADNPHLEAIPIFNKFKKDFGEKESSKILSCIYYIYDVSSPLLDGFKSEEDVILDVSETILKDVNFDWDKVSHIIEAYKKHVPSKAAVELLRFKNEITGLFDFLETWAWNEENVKDKITAVANSEKLWGLYLKYNDQVNAEKLSTGSHGGYSKSKIEKYRNK